MKKIKACLPLIMIIITTIGLTYDDDITNVINIDDAVTTKENIKSNSSLIALLVLVIGIAVAAIFIYFKKFRKNNSASFGVFGKDDDNDTRLQTHEKKTISFDDYITVNITSISD